MGVMGVRWRGTVAGKLVGCGKWEVGVFATQDVSKVTTISINLCENER